MLSVIYNPNVYSFQSHDPYEQLLLEQELQRRRQIEALQLRRQLQLEQLERRRQYEYARQIAELRRRREMEVESISACQYDRGVQNLLDALRVHHTPESTFSRRRSASPQGPMMTADTEQRKDEELSQNDASNGEPTSLGPVSTPIPTPESSSSANEHQADAEIEIETEASLTPNPSETNASYAAISHILSTLATIRSDFTFPSQLDFAPSATSSSPKLSYASTNAPVHQYEHQLTGLLTRLDAVESYGDGEVRKARKEAVKTVERELEELDGRKVEAWRRLSGFEELAEEKIEAVEHPAPTEATTDMDTSQPEEPTFVVDPAHRDTPDPFFVPLPQDENMDEPIPNTSIASTALSQDIIPTVPHPPALSPLTNQSADETINGTTSLPEPVLSSSHPPTISSTPHAQPCSDFVKPDQTSLNEPTGSETSDSELSDFVEIDTDMDVETMSTVSAEEVEQDRDLASIDGWELDF